MRLLSVLALLASGLLFGCADDGAQEASTPTGTTQSEAQASERLTRAEFIEAGDAICQGYDAARRPYEKDPEGYAELIEQVDVTVRLAEGKVRRLEALNPPGDGRIFIDQYLGLVQQQLALLQQLREAAEDEDQDEIRTYTQDLNDLELATRGLAQGFGFKECGTGI